MVWWIIRRLAGVHIARGVSIVWILNPFFWFAGEVATAYPHEAFFTCAIAAISILAFERKRNGLPLGGILPLLFTTLALAGAARPTMLFFLMPSTIYVVVVLRPSARTLLGAVALFASLIAVWFGILTSLAGGLDTYVALLLRPKTVLTNSILLGGTVDAHGAMLAKLLLYLVVGTLPLLSIGLIRLFRRRTPLFAPHITPLLWMLAAPPLLFFTFIFYENSGYLLSVYALSMIAAGLLLGRSDRSRRTATIWSAVWGVVWIIYFVVPIPGASSTETYRQHALASNYAHMANRYPDLAEKLHAAAVKLFMTASTAGVRAEDAAHIALLNTLAALPSSEEHQAILSTRWGFWPVYYRPRSTVYELFVTVDTISSTIRRWQRWQANDIPPGEIHIPDSIRDVVVIVWHDHWMFPDIARQVHLEPLSMPEYLDMYRITDPHFTLRINHNTIVR